MQYFNITKDGTPVTITNPNGVDDEGGTMVAAIWGYDYKYPIAQIVNGTYNEAISHLTVSMDVLQNLDGNALQDELNKIRQAMPNAQVTTYTYRPMVGVTSTIDPKGYAMYYEYDALYRLEIVRDGARNILSKNEYNYRTNN